MWQRFFNIKHRTPVGCGGAPSDEPLCGVHSRAAVGPTDVLELRSTFWEFQVIPASTEGPTKISLAHPVDAWMAVFPTKYNRRLKHIGRIGGAMRMGPPVKLVGDAPPQPGGVRS